MSNPIQAVTLISKGGTMVQLANQRGAPYPTTGFGALVFNTGAHLIDCVLENVNLQFDQVTVPAGTFEDPAIQFDIVGLNTPGFYSTGPGNISLVGTNGDESSRALLASFDWPGNLTIPGNVAVGGLITANGTIPPGDDSNTVPTTEWVNDAIAAGEVGDTIVFVGDAPPVSPVVSQLWWSSDLGELLIYYDDGNTVQWVPTSASSVGTVDAVYTVATLPIGAAASAGARAVVTDATTTTFNSVVVGGGANTMPVFSTGVDWRIG